MRERRKEARFGVAVPAALTPLESVESNVEGQFLDVSSHGVRVRVPESRLPAPRVGDLYRLCSGSDRMLCRVAHSHAVTDGTEIGFRIVFWNEPGELNQVVAENQRQSARQNLRDLHIPQFA